MKKVLKTLTEQAIQDMDGDALDRLHGDWSTILPHKFALPESFMRKFADQLDWVKIAAYQSMSAGFRKELKDRLPMGVDEAMEVAFGVEGMYEHPPDCRMSADQETDERGVHSPSRLNFDKVMHYISLAIGVVVLLPMLHYLVKRLVIKLLQYL